MLKNSILLYPDMTMSCYLSFHLDTCGIFLSHDNPVKRGRTKPKQKAMGCLYPFSSAGEDTSYNRDRGTECDTDLHHPHLQSKQPHLHLVQEQPASVNQAHTGQQHPLLQRSPHRRCRQIRLCCRRSRGSSIPCSDAQC